MENTDLKQKKLFKTVRRLEVEVNFIFKILFVFAAQRDHSTNEKWKLPDKKIFRGTRSRKNISGKFQLAVLQSLSSSIAHRSMSVNFLKW